MCLFYYCNFALGECKLYKGITNYIYNKYWGSTNYIYNRYWGVQIPGSTYYMLHRVWHTDPWPETTRPKSLTSDPVTRDPETRSYLCIDGAEFAPLIDDHMLELLDWVVTGRTASVEWHLNSANRLILFALFEATWTPVNIRRDSYVDSFKWLLKTYSFQISFLL